MFASRTSPSAARRIMAWTGAAGCCALGGYGLHTYYEQRHSTPPIDAALQVERLNHNTSRFRFGLPTEEHVLGLPAASHVLAVDNSMVSRAYTPVTLDKFERGYFDLIVKRYANGYFSEWFHRMKIGESMEFRGPVTTLRYEPNVVTTLGMVAGGTGITPMYQIIRTVLSEPKKCDSTRLRLLYANRTEADILLREELDTLAAAHPDRLQVRYLVEHATAAERAVHGGGGGASHVSVGLVGAAAIGDFMPSPREARAAVLVCGPEGMMRHLCGDPAAAARSSSRAQAPAGSPPALGGLLRQLGYGRQVVQFLDTC